MISRIKAWFSQYRARRKSIAALQSLISDIDALDGTYVILKNGYPLDPDDVFIPGDRLEIHMVDVPEEEERFFVEAIKRLNNKGFPIHIEEEDNA